MEEEHKFIIKSYHKGDLALMYHPCMTQAAAMGKMRRWINLNPDFKKRMKEAEISPLTHRYTSRQVAILVEFLGEP